ncbi:MAG TPA: SDR family NAD(P)-dependent oxidoreductase [Streptosporangiaceae bacterium]|nr:SDR family NAD(P)-dependent oxidoreductase [Streptosporangiaceae bacterium]
MESLDGRVAIVTGGARRIGRGIATVLQAAGADVVIADVNETGAQQTAADLSASGDHAVSIGADVTDKQAAED